MWFAFWSFSRYRERRHSVRRTAGLGGLPVWEVTPL